MPDIRHGKPIEEIEPFGGRILGSVMRKLKEDKECDPMESVAYALGSIADTMWLSYLLEKQKYEDSQKRSAALKSKGAGVLS
ncbi:unnamed protein product [Sphagnum jensenii]